MKEKERMNRGIEDQDRRSYVKTSETILRVRTREKGKNEGKCSVCIDLLNTELIQWLITQCCSIYTLVKHK